MIARASQYWWIPVVRGALAMVFGALAIWWPGLTLAFLVVFFGAYMFVDGLFALGSAIRFRHEREQWVPLLFEGVIGLVIGAITFFYPGIAALAWVYTIAFWAFVTGALEIVAAVRMARHGGSARSEVLLALTGIASLLLGAVMVGMPAAGLLAWVWVIGAYAIVFGAFLIGFGVRLRAAGAARSGAGSLGAAPRA
jgi:uncharacterized membrane protein HdeD (DUF308 family)